MRRHLSRLALAAGCAALLIPAVLRPAATPGVTMVLHGGAGTILKKNMTPETERAVRETLGRALEAGYAVLTKGGPSLDAVEAAIRILEDSPLFNAGRGAVFTSEGRNEMDAAIMDGATRRAGAVASVTTVEHPISAARAVMERTRHVLLVGAGAEALARSAGLNIVSPLYFWTQRRWDQLQAARAKTAAAPPAPSGAPHEHGTVGALALDRRGHLAAGTSTGGLTDKMAGRVGDSPIIGAGTYAGDHCAVSGTGTGEYFMRYLVAYDICARREYTGVSLAEAARAVIHDELQPIGGDGGVIALDDHGDVATPFNTPGMYRGWIGPDGVVHVRLYRDEGEEPGP